MTKEKAKGIQTALWAALVLVQMSVVGALEVRAGIAEYIRMKSMQITDRAMLSRGVSVIRKKTLIVNLPGSPKAVKESLGFILGALDHGLKILRGTASECARK